MKKGKPHTKRVLDVSTFPKAYRDITSIDGTNELMHQGVTSIEIEKLVAAGLEVDSIAPKAAVIRLTQILEMLSQQLIEQRRLREVIEQALKN